MTKEKFIKNLSDALEGADQYIDPITVDWIADMVDDKDEWKYSTFRDFVHDICDDWGDYFRVLRSMGYIDGLESHESEVKEWINKYQNCDFYAELLSYCSVTSIDDADIESIADWFKDREHRDEYKMVLWYIKENKDSSGTKTAGQTYYISFDQQGYNACVIKVQANNPGEARAKALEVFCMGYDIAVSKDKPATIDVLLNEAGEEI